MVRVPAANVVDRGFGSQSGQTKNYKIGIAKNGLAGIRVGRHVYPRTVVSVHEPTLLKIQLSVLV
jgi:hypothetical protein